MLRVPGHREQEPSRRRREAERMFGMRRLGPPDVHLGRPRTSRPSFQRRKMVLRGLQDVRRLWQHWRLDVSAVLLQLRKELPHGLPGPARRQEAQVSVEVSALSGPPRQGAEGGGGQQREEKNR
jgi:hypothetical protein